LDGYLIWLVMLIMTLILFVAIRFLPEKAEGKVVKSVDDGDA
jgi:hypothetical protein